MIKKKLPFMPLYIGDELRSGIQHLSLQADGLWKRMRMVMWDAEKRGYLQQIGQPMNPRLVAKMCNTNWEEYEATMSELVSAKIPAFTKHGVIYDPIMVEQNRLSVVRSRAGKLGGNPLFALPKGKANTDIEVEVKISGYKNAVEHIFTTYKNKKATKMPFGKAQGQTIKDGLSTYTLPEFKALWDSYLSKSWNWETREGKLVKVGHDLLHFRTKWTVLVDEPLFRSKKAEYEKSEPVDPINASAVSALLGGATKAIPK